MSPVQAGEVTSEIVIGAPPETVFPYFTDPERMVRWMGTEAVMDARPGGAYRILVGGRYAAAGEFVELDPPNRVVFTWGWEGGEMSVAPGASTVEVTLTPEDDGTRVVLVHRDLPEDSRAPHAHGWEHYVQRLAIAASGGDAGPDHGPGGGD
jgi:uncharacterized protein YndB with AHSA1/START domain